LALNVNGQIQQYKHEKGIRTTHCRPCRDVSMDRSPRPVEVVPERARNLKVNINLVLKSTVAIEP
jgi:hypothetical protein